MKPKAKLGVSWLRVGYLLLAAVVMALLVGQLRSFRGSISQLKTSDISDCLAVLAGTIATFLLAALTYYFIALKPIKYVRTVVVETGINTLNRLLPAGIGGIGANYVYLTRSRHTKGQAGAVVAANTVLGIIANLLLLAGLLIYFPAQHFKYSSLSPRLVLVGCIVVILAVVVAVSMPAWRHEIASRIKSIFKNIYNYRHFKLRLIYGLICQMGLTLAFVLALSFSLKAVHGYLPIGSLMLAYSFSIWLGAIIPAPGGAGTVDAGLVAGLVAFRVDLPQAVAAVLIFRLISFWLPLVLGVGPLILSYKRGYL